MRVTDEQIKLLHCHNWRGTQHLDQGGGWQSPSVVHKAAVAYRGEVFSARAYSGVIAKVSGLLRRLRGSGNGNLCVRGICIASEHAAHSDMRVIPDLDLGQCFPLGADELAASR